MTIKNLIFDLGGVWLPIDEKRTLAAFAALTNGDTAIPNAASPSQDRYVADIRERSGRGRRNSGLGTPDTDAAAQNTASPMALAARLQPDVLAYELGQIDDATLLARLRNALAADNNTAAATLSEEALTAAWNAMLLPFPKAHLPLLDAYGQHYRLFLLSNTNALHIRHVEQDFHNRFPDRKPFLQHFEKAYLSHELHLRKPQPEIYTHVLRDAGLKAAETLFIDDRAENIAAADALGIHTRLHPANAPLTALPL